MHYACRASLDWCRALEQSIPGKRSFRRIWHNRRSTAAACRRSKVMSLLQPCLSSARLHARPRQFERGLAGDADVLSWSAAAHTQNLLRSILACSGLPRCCDLLTPASALLSAASDCCARSSVCVKVVRSADQQYCMLIGYRIAWLAEDDPSLLGAVSSWICSGNSGDKQAHLLRSLLHIAKLCQTRGTCRQRLTFDGAGVLGCALCAGHLAAGAHPVSAAAAGLRRRLPGQPAVLHVPAPAHTSPGHELHSKFGSHFDLLLSDACKTKL